MREKPAKRIPRPSRHFSFYGLTQYGYFTTLHDTFQGWECIFLSRSSEKDQKHPDCPCCGEPMHLRDSKKRIVKDSDGNRYTAHLNRFRCDSCDTIHTQIPDCLVPYHQYPADLIAGALAGRDEATPAVDSSTVYRWNIFYYKLVRFIRSCQELVDNPVFTRLSGFPDDISLLRESLMYMPKLISVAAIYYFLTSTPTLHV